jgi:hypothetical protein
MAVVQPQQAYGDLAQACFDAGNEVQLIAQHVQPVGGGQAQVLAQLAQIQAQLQQLQASQGQFQAQLGPVAILAARAYNRSLGSEDALAPVPHVNGNVPINFPATKAACLGLRGQALNNLLGFYGLPVNGTVEAKRLRLHRHIDGN